MQLSCISGVRSIHISRSNVTFSLGHVGHQVCNTVTDNIVTVLLESIILLQVIYSQIFLKFYTYY